MTQELYDEFCAREKAGEDAYDLAEELWRKWGFKSRKSLLNSLYHKGWRRSRPPRSRGFLSDERVGEAVERYNAGESVRAIALQRYSEWGYANVEACAVALYRIIPGKVERWTGRRRTGWMLAAEAPGIAQALTDVSARIQSLKDELENERATERDLMVAGSKAGLSAPDLAVATNRTPTAAYAALRSALRRRLDPAPSECAATLGGGR